MSKKHWDKSFKGKDYVYGKEENVFINEKSHLIPPRSKVACFAEGEGRNAVYLAKQDHEVFVYDQSEVGLEKAKQLAIENNVSIQTEAIDLTKKRVPNEMYDAAIMVYGHVLKQDQPFFIENILNSVKPGGIILIEVYSQLQLQYKTGGPQSIEMLYDPVDMITWTKMYKNIHFFYGEAERVEGKRHTGLGHIIQIA